VIVITENSTYKIEEFPDYFSCLKIDETSVSTSGVPIGYGKVIGRDRRIYIKVGEPMIFGGLHTTPVCKIIP